MDAWDVARLFVDKMVVPAEPSRRGDPGYGRLKALGVLICFRLNGLEDDTWIVEHFRKCRQVIRSRALRLLEGGGNAPSACWRRFLNGSPVSFNS